MASVELDGVSQPEDAILLSNDGLTHEVRVVMGERISNAEADALETQSTSQQRLKCPAGVFSLRIILTGITQMNRIYQTGFLTVP